MKKRAFSTMLQSGFPSFLKAPIVELDESKLMKVKPKACILGVPFDSTSLYRTGTNFGPRAIREASEQFLGYHMDFELNIFEAFNLVDCGDVNTVPGNAKKTFNRIEQAVSKVLKVGAIPIVLGGEHSITFPAVKALAKNARVGLISLDTHLDCADESIGGEKLSHATPIARIAELKNVNPTNIVIVGAHGALNPLEEKEYAQQHGITVFTVTDILEKGIGNVIDQPIEIVQKDTDMVYLTVDIDVLDAAYAPGTCSPEPGGLTSRELLQIIRIIGSIKINAFDVVEVAPQYDLGGITARIASRVILDMLGVIGSKTID